MGHGHLYMCCALPQSEGCESDLCHGAVEQHLHRLALFPDRVLQLGHEHEVARVLEPVVHSVVVPDTQTKKSHAARAGAHTNEDAGVDTIQGCTHIRRGTHGQCR